MKVWITIAWTSLVASWVAETMENSDTGKWRE